MTWRIDGNVEIFTGYNNLDAQIPEPLLIVNPKVSNFTLTLIKTLVGGPERLETQCYILMPDEPKFEKFIIKSNLPGSFYSPMNRNFLTAINTSIKNVFLSKDEAKRFFVKINEQLLSAEIAIPDDIIERVVNIIDIKEPSPEIAAFFVSLSKLSSIEERSKGEVSGLLELACKLDNEDPDFSRCLYHLFLWSRDNNDIDTMLNISKKISRGSTYIFEIAEELGHAIFSYAANPVFPQEKRREIMKKAVAPLLAGSMHNDQSFCLLAKCLGIIASGCAELSLSGDTGVPNTQSFDGEFDAWLIQTQSFDDEFDAWLIQKIPNLLVKMANAQHSAQEENKRLREEIARKDAQLLAVNRPATDSVSCQQERIQPTIEEKPTATLKPSF